MHLRLVLIVLTQSVVECQLGRDLSLLEETGQLGATPFTPNPAQLWSTLGAQVPG